MPARACASGEAWVRSALSNRIRPALGAVSPARQLKKVDLPAPLGPISPTISPSAIERLAPDTARKLPKALHTFSASSSIASPRQPRCDAIPQFVQAARLEPGEQNDDAAIKNVGQAGAAATEPGIARRLQRHEDQGADERTQQRTGSAERGDDHHLDRDENAEPGFRIDEAGFDRVERARNRGQNGAQHERFELALPHRYAEAACRALSCLDGAQIVAEAAALDRVAYVQQHREHAEEDVIVGQLAAKSQIPPGAPNGWPLQSDGSADKVPGTDEDANQFRDRDRRHAEIVSAQAKGR